MKHFLAYGNSDQASFRDPAVRECFDVMTVPGTIAAYYADATAAFVLSSELDYIIDPRTPLFQEVIDVPRASHFALASHCGAAIARVLAEGDGAVAFPADFYTADVVTELVNGILSFQLGYGRRAGEITAQLTRYAALLAESRGLQPIQTAAADNQRAPAFILAPYFAMMSPDDPWGDLNRKIWDACVSAAEEPRNVSAVVAVTDVRSLTAVLERIPEELSRATFFWIAGLNERRSSIADLSLLWEGVAAWGGHRDLVNLYGGFFSICLHYAGLFGFNNGLGYSESRDWPELGATGAAPARYYMPALHLFVSPAVAQLICEQDDWFRCACSVCLAQPDGRVVGLSYHRLKAHFALARRQELELVTTGELATVVDGLRTTASRFNSLRRRLPPGMPDVTHLLRWAEVLEDHG